MIEYLDADLIIMKQILLASWRGTRFEVTQILREVVDKVLKEPGVSDAVLLKRAKVRSSFHVPLLFSRLDLVELTGRVADCAGAVLSILSSIFIGIGAVLPSYYRTSTTAHHCTTWLSMFYLDGRNPHSVDPESETDYGSDRRLLPNLRYMIFPFLSLPGDHPMWSDLQIHSTR